MIELSKLLTSLTVVVEVVSAKKKQEENFQKIRQYSSGEIIAYFDRHRIHNIKKGLQANPYEN